MAIGSLLYYKHVLWFLICITNKYIVVFRTWVTFWCIWSDQNNLENLFPGYVNFSSKINGLTILPPIWQTKWLNFRLKHSLVQNNQKILDHIMWDPTLPWIQISCLASYLLASNRQRLSQDWQDLYNHPVYLLETFVDTERYQGTCYKADNWTCVGQTTGQGKLSKSRQPLLSKKAVYVYPLTKNFRRELCHDAWWSTGPV